MRGVAKYAGIHTHTHLYIYIYIYIRGVGTFGVGNVVDLVGVSMMMMMCRWFKGRGGSRIMIDE